MYPSIRSAPTLKIWITPLASVAMLEKLALLKIALCNAPALSSSSSARLRSEMSREILDAPTTSPAALRGTTVGSLAHVQFLGL